MAKDDARLLRKSEVEKNDAAAKEREKISDPDGSKRKAADARRDVERREFNARKAQSEANLKDQIDRKVKAYEAKQAAARQAAAKAKPPIVTEGEAAQANAGRAKSFVEGRDAAAANAGEAQRVAAMKSANPPSAAATPPPSAAATPRLGPPSGSPAASNALVPRGGAAPPNQLAIRPSGPLVPNSPRISGNRFSGKFGKIGGNVGNMALAAGANFAKRKIEEQDPSSIMGQAAQGVGLVGTGAMEGAALGRQFAGGLGAGVGAVVGGINAPVQYLLRKEGDRRVENIQHEGRRKELEGNFARAADPLNAEDRRRRQADARQDYLESQPKYYDPNSGLSQDGLPSGRYLNAPDLSSLQGSAEQGSAEQGSAGSNLGVGLDNAVDSFESRPTPTSARTQTPAASAKAQSDQFRRYHGTAFDPNSKLDRQKMKAMQGAGVQMDKFGMGPQAPATRKTLTAANMYDNPNRKYSGNR